MLQAFAEKGLEAAREVEARHFGELVVSSVAHRLIEIFFAQTALKKDSGVDDPSVKPRPVEKVAMLGAGLMGGGIAYVTMNAGIPVRLKDKDDAALGRGLKYVADILDEDVKKKKLTKLERDQKMALLSGTTDYAGMKSADLVIEAVFEDLDVKHKVVREIEAAGKEGLIFASNTSSIPITKIAAGSKHPENVVGMHYFCPVHKMPLLEVIQTKQTSPEVVATAVAIGKKQGKTVIVVNDGTGFYTSRILGPMMNEASYLLTEGVSVEAIDKAHDGLGLARRPGDAARRGGHRRGRARGPHHGGRLRRSHEPAAHHGQARRRRPQGPQEPAWLLPLRRRQEGQGQARRRERLCRARPAGARSKAKPKVAAEEIQMRCSLQLVNEALHCFGEGILRSPRDGDIGAIFGLGFPPFRGGPFRYVDAIGAAEALKRIQGYEQQHGTRWTPAPVLVEMAKSRKRFLPVDRVGAPGRSPRSGRRRRIRSSRSDIDGTPRLLIRPPPRRSPRTRRSSCPGHEAPRTVSPGKPGRLTLARDPPVPPEMAAASIPFFFGP